MTKCEHIINWIRDWFDKNGKDCNAVVGLSGGKDSTIVAALCVKALGKDRVIGVAMPQDGQDLNGADAIAEWLGIDLKVVNIGEACRAIENSLGFGLAAKYKISDQSKQNIPPRVRMTVLYAISQSNNGRVSCNCNKSEDWIGYSTRWGDSAGDFAPIAAYTVSEVREIGHELGIPIEWVDKVPDDGLPLSKPDEEKFGFTYDELDNYILKGIVPKGHTPDGELKVDKINRLHDKNVFKLHMYDVCP